jgi:hypothetical protein
VGYGREQFPRELQTREAYNQTLEIQNESIKKKDELAYKRYMLQSMALNKNRYENFFGSLDFSQPFNREDLKKALSEHPIPEHPETFDFYMPSPQRESNEEAEKETKKQAQAKIIKRITRAFKKLLGEKIEVEEEHEEFLDPLEINNCLITALNGGVGASQAQVTLIRYLLFEEMDIPYGELLPARPEVIYTIATVLNIRNHTLAINSSDGELQQVFLIMEDGTVIEREGDEVEDLSEFGLNVLAITHDGEDHFEFESLV